MKLHHWLAGGVLELPHWSLLFQNDSAQTSSVDNFSPLLLD